MNTNIELINLTNGPYMPIGRRAGNTTRQIDFAVQMLFAGCEIEVVDHSQVQNEHLETARKITIRIRNEHPNDIVRLRAHSVESKTYPHVKTIRMRLLSKEEFRDTDPLMLPGYPAFIFLKQRP